MRSEEEDRMLMAGVAQRDPQSLMQLYDRYADLCYGLACRLLGEETAAEMAVERVFLLLWRQAPMMEIEQSNPRVWLLTRMSRRAAVLPGEGEPTAAAAG